MQGRAMLDAVPAGNYAFIKGNKADPNSDFLFGGTMEILGEAVDAGDIVNVGEQYTDNWDPSVAQRNMEQILTDNDNAVDAVVAQNDGTAGGAIAALDAQGMAGIVPVSGQDAEGAALNRIAKGLQTQTVWVDARVLGEAAANVAVALAGGAALEEIEGSGIFSDGPNGVDMNSVLLTPVSVTQENLGELIEAGWITEEELCAGVDAGSVAACP